MAGLASRKGDMMLSNGSSDAAGNGYTWGGNSSVLHHGFDITDIRRDGIENSLRAELLQKLQPEAGAEKQMPTLLLYNEAGLRLFEDITYLEEYYLTNAEIEVLERYADAIAERIRPGSIMMELGSGNLRKVKILLDAMERKGQDLEYFALDLCLPELNRTLSQLRIDSYTHVKCHGLHGTYDDGLAWLKSPERRLKPKCVMSLGSSIGNFSRPEASNFLGNFSKVLQPGDIMIIGLDACKKKEKVLRAYNDEKGLTHEFLLNGLAHANGILGEDVFQKTNWIAIGEYDEGASRHQAFYSPLKDITSGRFTFKAGEKIRIEESHKYSAEESSRLWRGAGLSEGARWTDNTGDYHIHMLSKPTFLFSLDPKEYARTPAPELAQWFELWAAWDTLTKGMIPKEELLSKPIELRNPYIFYLGHVPTFLEIHLARATDGKFTGRPSYQRIFERGIDPDVDNPEHCHAHSEVPDSWPLLNEILSFQEHVRNRVKHFYGLINFGENVKLPRALWLAFEHEAMHVETLLYMLLQGGKILPPPGIIRPDFEALAREAALEPMNDAWVTIPETKLSLGLGLPEKGSGRDQHYGWDNEIPSREVVVRPFLSKAKPITNGEYARYLEETRNEAIPASWAERSSRDSLNSKAGSSGSRDHINGFRNAGTKVGGYLEGKFARTVFGAVPLAQALHWPVIASYNELAGYATWMNGRIPTYEEVRSIYQYVDQSNLKPAAKVLAQKIAAVNGHLSNNGVEETPPSGCGRKSFSGPEHSPNPDKLFAQLEGCNVGFTHWHPVPASSIGDSLCGQSNMGGVWEWTSSVLERLEGFEPMDLYPAYTADFFDGKHNIVQGGSWATHPRIAGRRTFINWYQRNYRYVWAGARLVRDL